MRLFNKWRRKKGEPATPVEPASDLDSQAVNDAEQVAETLPEPTQELTQTDAHVDAEDARPSGPSFDGPTANDAEVIDTPVVGTPLVESTGDDITTESETNDKPDGDLLDLDLGEHDNDAGLDEVFGEHHTEEFDEDEEEEAPVAAAPARPGLFGRLRSALRRTGSGLVGGVAGLFSGGRVVDADLIDELETLLLSADVGIDATDRILEGISGKLKRKQLGDADAVIAALKDGMLEILQPVEQPLEIPTGRDKPYVILMVGVNGAGKTTTIGKLTQRFQSEKRSVILAAGDTFRAAAIEQLQTWGDRHGVPVVAQQQGSDSASVAYDALQSATARNIDVLIADTAGRLHTQTGLMDELSKVHRVIGKQDPEAPHEVLLVLDAGTGQNAIVQAEQFSQAVNVTGIVLTKLDGTAKGGVILSIAERIGVPIRFIGVGEQAEDLREFRAKDFVDALLAPVDGSGST